MGAGRRSDTTLLQDVTGYCQATPDQRDARGGCNQLQDAGDAGDTKTTSLTSGRNTCASDARFIFTDGAFTSTLNNYMYYQQPKLPILYHHPDIA